MSIILFYIIMLSLIYNVIYSELIYKLSENHAVNPRAFTRLIAFLSVNTIYYGSNFQDEVIITHEPKASI